MKMRLGVLRGAAGIALGAVVSSTAFADVPMGFAGTVGAEYANTSCSGCSSVDDWSLNGSAAYGLGMGKFAIQGDAGYRNVSASGPDLDIWNIGGKAFWAGSDGRFGATLDYNSLDTSGANGHITSYGAFAEGYLSQFVTVSLRGGGFSVSGNAGGFGTAKGEGGYVGGGITGYVMPNLALAANLDYAAFKGGHLTSYGASAEYLVSEMMPVSVYVGYANTQLFTHVDTFFIGVKYYTDGNGSTLIERQRNGALDRVGLGSAFAF